MQRLFIINDPIPDYAEFLVSIDISKWLGTEEINSVAFTAKNKATGESATTTAIDTVKCTYTATVVKPFIKGTSDGETYIVTMQVASDGSPVSKEEFYLEFTCKTNIPGIGD